MARLLDTPLAIALKERVGNEEHVEARGLLGDVENRDVLIVDDEILTGGTIMEAAAIAIEHGAKSVSVACVHPFLSGNAVDRICNSEIEELVVTDTIPLPPEKRHAKIKTLSLAPLLGEAIKRINSGPGRWARLFQ